MNDDAIQQAAHVIAQAFGEQLEQVILHGSRAAGTARPDSDYDFAVILSDYDLGDGKGVWSAQMDAEREAAVILGGEVDLVVMNRARLERNKALYLNIEAKILKGRVLVDTGRRAVVSMQPPSLETLKMEAARWMMRACAVNLSDAAKHQADEIDLSGDICLCAVRAFCWSIKAQLALLGIDTTDISVRWNPAALVELGRDHGLKIPDVSGPLESVKDLRLAQIDDPSKVQEQLVMSAVGAAETAVASLPDEVLIEFAVKIIKDIEFGEELTSKHFDALNHVGRARNLRQWFGANERLKMLGSE